MHHHFLCTGSYGLRWKQLPWRSQEQFFGGREKDEHIGWGACCISEHKDWKSIKEKEQAGREENMGI